MHKTHPIVASAAFALWASAASSQEPIEPASRPTSVSISRSCGLQHLDDGRLVGLGDRYVAEFGAQGISYTPALGMRAPHDLPLRFEMTGVGRGESVVPPQAAARSDADLTVAYRRGDVVETYEIRGDGVKQSFVFHRLPVGGGDLVVRGRLTTELIAGVADASGVTYSLPGIGGVQIGAVLGIDARGREVRGSLQPVAGGIEYRLPAAFVDAAALPLVLDPLLGTTVTLGGASDDEQPDVAFDFSTLTWIAVWQRIFSGTNADIRAQRIDYAGALVGNQISVESNSATFARQPRVANINGEDAFVIAYGYGGDIFARGLFAASAFVTAEVTIASNSNNQINPVIGGEAMDIPGGQAVIAWEDASLTDVFARPVSFSGAALVAGAQQVLATGFSDGQPAISKSGGQSGNWLIVWVRQATTGADTIRGILYRRDNTLSPTTYGMSNEVRDCTTPAVDGDGDNWVVAFAVRETTGTDYDIVASQISWGAGQLVRRTSAIVEGQAGDDEYRPSVAWTAQAVLVGWQDEVGVANYDTYLRSLDPFGCTLCEGTFNLGVTASNETFTNLATAFSAGSFGARNAAVVWTSHDTAAGQWDVQFQMFRNRAGSLTELGGACGAGGRAFATCARTPNPLFYARLRGGPASTPVWGVIGFDRANYTCGPCTLLPDPFTGVVWAQTSDVYGDTQLNLPIVAGAGGMQFLLQYVSLGTTCSFGIETSTAIQVGIEN